MQLRILLWGVLLALRAAVYGGVWGLKLDDGAVGRASQLELPASAAQPAVVVAAPAPAPADLAPPIQDEDPGMSSREEYVDAVLDPMDDVDIGLSLEVPLERQPAHAEGAQPQVPRNVVRKIKSVKCLEKLLRDSSYNCSQEQLLGGTAGAAPAPRPHGG
mmetsp:Transcript_52545/g.97284  ORF Transcript_52545/g.97284 Transcript_52545/m.97284 type:complete len:160 (-) Transcript_52545:78-557(-)